MILVAICVVVFLMQTVARRDSPSVESTLCFSTAYRDQEGRLHDNGLNDILTARCGGSSRRSFCTSASLHLFFNMWWLSRSRHHDRSPPRNASTGGSGLDLGDRLQSRPVSLDGTDRSRRAAPLRRHVGRRLRSVRLHLDEGALPARTRDDLAPQHRHDHALVARSLHDRL